MTNLQGSKEFYTTLLFRFNMKVPMRYCDRNTLKFHQRSPELFFFKIIHWEFIILSSSSSTTFQKDKLAITSHGVFQNPPAHHEGWMDG
jgi:hypothetical protein